MVVVAGRGALRPFCGEDARLLALWADLGAPRYGYQLALLVLRALPAGAVLAVGASMALHHWHRVFAEAMRFRARAFTRAWWNAACYAEYFRDWNQIVKAWLNKYVFKEMLTLGFSSMTSKLATVAVSAVWHEYIVAASLGYFLPYFFSFYVISAVIVLIEPPGLQKKPFGNLFVILTLSGGIASILSIYFMESTARQNCPQIVGAPWDFFVPRSVICEEPFKNCTFL
ncbi:sterol O-acyltransferase 1-like [Frankliniella occidentalis]|uniref:Sterol O-acyltransferase 1-like n=1 Tax=Frankliniella occidentalis TaxID=133901 RepID=A0A9C6WYH1_FRAOC|nr:sterol O-acyltransferase 1-like [Frankliniella occidentalis]